jgi:uncharacterized membrane protein
MTNRPPHARFFPWRYGMFLALLALCAPLAFVLPWHEAVMAGFDIAAAAFLVTVIPLLGADIATMRRLAERNDVNRQLMLLITGVVAIVILVAVGVAVSARGGPRAPVIALLLATLMLAWLFTNMVYAMHYAHIFYLRGSGGGDSGGIDFPATEEPRYWDFIYFAFTLGMTFQTSDVAIQTQLVRRIATFHCFAAFIFNLGIIAFTINVLGGG